MYTRIMATITLEDFPETLAKNFTSPSISFSVFIDSLDDQWIDYPVGIGAGDFAKMLKKEWSM